MLNQDFKEFIQFLNDNHVQYLIVGGYAGVDLYFARAKHSGRQFIGEKRIFTAGMLRFYEDIYKIEMHPILL